MDFPENIFTPTTAQAFFAEANLLVGDPSQASPHAMNGVARLSVGPGVAPPSASSALAAAPVSLSTMKPPSMGAPSMGAPKLGPVPTSRLSKSAAKAAAVSAPAAVLPASLPVSLPASLSLPLVGSLSELVGDVVIPAGRRLEFDPDKLVVEDLREELRLRGLASSGSKPVLLQRLQEAVASQAEIPLQRLVFRETSSPQAKKRKRNHNKREPLRDEFDSEEAYLDSWHKWRDTRDNNNESVKRSREHARQRRSDHEQLCHEREEENRQLVEEVQMLRQQVSCLSKVLQQPDALTPDEQLVVRNLLDPVAGLGTALDSDTMSGSSVA